MSATSREPTRKARDTASTTSARSITTGFEAKKYKTANEEKKTDDAIKLMKAAWDKSITEKNADGKVYGDLIKEGKLPSKNE